MTEKEAERVGMKAISSVVYNIISQEQNILQEDLFDKVIEYFSNFVNSDSLENIRKRIYDVIQILEATGIFRKNEKTLIFQKHSCKINKFSFLSEYDKISEKESALIQRLNVLTKYKAIISKNTLLERPEESITLPFLIIAVKNTDTKYQQSFDKRSLEINLKDVFSFLSPLNIVQKTVIDQEILKSIWEKSKYSNQINLPDFDIKDQFL